VLLCQFARAHPVHCLVQLIRSLYVCLNPTPLLLTARFFTSKFAKTRTNVFSPGEEPTSRVLILRSLEKPPTEAYTVLQQTLRKYRLLSPPKPKSGGYTSTSSSSSSSLSSSSSSSSGAAAAAKPVPDPRPPKFLLPAQELAKNATYPYEVLFRSMNKYLRDAVVSEYLFDIDFFGKVNLFDSLFGKAVHLFMVRVVAVGRWCSFQCVLQQQHQQLFLCRTT